MRRWVVFWLALWLAIHQAFSQPLQAGPYQIKADYQSNQLKLHITRDGKPAAHTPVVVLPEMLDMDMGSKPQNLKTDQSGDIQAPLQLGMKGKWRIKITVAQQHQAEYMLDTSTTASPPGQEHNHSHGTHGMAPSSTEGVSANGIPTGPPRPWLGNPAKDTPPPAEITPPPPTPTETGMGLEEAVRLGLSRNPDLLKALQELGIPNADVIQAGLISNPTLSGQYKFADRPGFNNYWEASLTQNVMDFLLRGQRLTVAETELKAATLRVERVIFEASTHIKAAYFRLQADQQKLQLTQTMQKAASAAAELALRQRRANTVSQLDLVRQQAVQAETQAELYEVQGELQVDREALIRLLGNPDNADQLAFHSVLPSLPEDDPKLEELQVLAVEKRQEVAAARLDETAARQGYDLASRFFGIDEVRVGVSSSREVEGVQITGPVMQLPLPIFNQNQGVRARYQAKEKIAQLAVSTALQNARYEVRQAYRQLQAARNQALTARERTIPLRRQALKLAEQQFNNMFLGIYGLLTIYREELDARKQYVEALREYWTARAELEKAVGTDLPVTRKETTP